MRRKSYNTYRCGGYASYTGHCGALDCETCHPGGARAMALEEATAELQGRLEEAEAEQVEVDTLLAQIGDEDSDEAKALAARLDEIEARIRAISDEIEDIERSFDGDDEPDDYNREDDFEDDFEDDRDYEVDWESPY